MQCCSSKNCTYIAKILFIGIDFNRLTLSGTADVTIYRTGVSRSEGGITLSRGSMSQFTSLHNLQVSNTLLPLPVYPEVGTTYTVCIVADPGSDAFLTPGYGIRDPGWVKNQDPVPG